MQALILQQAAPALERGYAVLFYDGPGQGEVSPFVISALWAFSLCHHKCCTRMSCRMLSALAKGSGLHSAYQLLTPWMNLG